MKGTEAPQMVVQLTADELRELLVAAVNDALPHPDDWLDLKQLTKEFGFSRESLASAARDGLAVSKGPKGRLLVRRSDVEAWLVSRPWKAPAPKQKTEDPNEDPEVEYGRQLARLEVVR